MELFELKTYILSKVSHRLYHFESLKQYYLNGKQYSLGVQNHPEDQGDWTWFNSKYFRM